MIIVDTALADARGRGQADPRRHGRRRVHGPRPGQPDRQLGAAAWSSSPSRTAPSPTPSAPTPRPAWSRSRVDHRGRARRRDQPRARPAVHRGRRSCSATREQLDCVVDVTGAVEFGARVAVAAIERGKHVVTMNAELDGTVGPLLKAQGASRRGRLHRRRRRPARRAGQPAAASCRASASRRWSAGNIKGLQDAYRTPTTQKGFAERWGQNPYMVTSFADGTKVSFEQAIVANAFGLTVPRRGMQRLRPRRARRRAHRAATTWTSCASSAASSTTWWARSPAPASSCSARTTTRSSATT